MLTGPSAAPRPELQTLFLSRCTVTGPAADIRGQSNIKILPDRQRDRFQAQQCLTRWAGHPPIGTCHLADRGARANSRSKPLYGLREESRRDAQLWDAAKYLGEFLEILARNVPNTGSISVEFMHGSPALVPSDVDGYHADRAKDYRPEHDRARLPAAPPCHWSGSNGRHRVALLRGPVPDAFHIPTATDV